MKKNDTALYKLKVAAVSVLLCGLFTVFAVGCSSNDGGKPDESENNLLSDDRSNNAVFEPGTSISKITFPPMLPSTDHTGSFGNGRPTETKPAPEAGKITIGELEIIPITRPDPTEPPESSAAAADDTRLDIDLPRVTLNPNDSFDIVDDTTATEVYGFNG